MDDLALDVRRWPSVGVLEENVGRALGTSGTDAVACLAMSCQGARYAFHEDEGSASPWITIRPLARIGVSLSLVLLKSSRSTP